MSEQHQTDFADRSARVLREARARIAPQRSVDPEPGIEMVAGAIRGIASRQRRRRLTLSVAAAGALCAGAMAVFAAVHGQPTVTPPSVAAAAAKPVDNGFVEVGATPASLRAGDRLHSGSRAVELDARDGTSVRLAVGSDLQLLRADAERWLRLAAGTVSVHVAKLQPGQRFVIVTPDAEVEVRGTRFQVQVGDENDGCGKATHVRVDEGIVEVRSGGSAVRVPAGGRWPTGCEATPASAAAPAASGLVRAAAVVAHPAARRPRPSSEPAPAKLATASAAADVARASTLATENDLFGSALRAEHHGDRREAIELLDVLLSRFPGTPLRASALAARDRLSQAGP